MICFIKHIRGCPFYWDSPDYFNYCRSFSKPQSIQTSQVFKTLRSLRIQDQ